MKPQITRCLLSFSALAMLSGCAVMGQIGDSMWSGTKKAADKTGTTFAQLLRPAPKQDIIFDTGDAGLNTHLLEKRAGQFVAHAELEEARRRFNPPMNFRQAPSERTVPELRGLQPVSRLQSTEKDILGGGRYAQGPHYENGVKVYRPFERTAPQPQYRPQYHPQPAAVPAPSQVPAPTYVWDDSMTLAGPAPTGPLSAPVQTYSPSAPQPEAAPTTDDDELSYVKMGGGSDIADWQDCEAEAGGFVLFTLEGYIPDPDFDACMRERGYKPESEAEAALLLPR